MLNQFERKAPSVQATKGDFLMIGISWRRVQGPADALLRKMLAERGLDNVPQWTKKDDVRTAASEYWLSLAKGI